MTLKITMELGLEPGFDQGAYQTFMLSAAMLGQQGHPRGASNRLGVDGLAGVSGMLNTTALVQAGPGVGMTAAIPELEAGALDTGPETTEEQMAADAAEEAARVAGAEPPKRRPRRTKAEIEADAVAATRRTLEAAAASGMVPGVAPAPVAVQPSPVAVPPAAPVAVPPSAVAAPVQIVQTAAQPVAVPPTAPSIAVPPGVVPQAPAPVQVAVPPTAAPPAVVPQAPSMPAAPPPGGPMTVAHIREAIRQINMTHPGVPFRVQKSQGWFTPEMIPADKYDWFLEELQNVMNTTPPVQA